MTAPARAAVRQVEAVPSAAERFQAAQRLQRQRAAAERLHTPEVRRRCAEQSAAAVRAYWIARAERFDRERAARLAELRARRPA